MKLVVGPLILFKNSFIWTWMTTWIWASLVAQKLNNPPAMQDSQVQSLGQEDPVEESMATHSSIFTWRILWTEEPVATVHRVVQSWTWLKQLSMHTQPLGLGLRFHNHIILPFRKIWNPGIISVAICLAVLTIFGKWKQWWK